MAGASPSGHRWDALIGRPGICQFLREADGGQAGWIARARVFVENALGRGVSGVGRVRRELRTPELGGVLSGSRPRFPVLQLTGLVSVGGVNSQSGQQKRRKRFYNQPEVDDRGRSRSRLLFSLLFPSSFSWCSPPSPTLICHFLPPAHTRPFWWLSFASPSFSSAGILIKPLML